MADIKQILGWLEAGKAVVGSPLVQKLLPLIAADLKLTDAERAQLDANFADGSARRERAQKAAGTSAGG